MPAPNKPTNPWTGEKVVQSNPSRELPTFRSTHTHDRPPALLTHPSVSGRRRPCDVYPTRRIILTHPRALPLVRHTHHHPEPATQRCCLITAAVCLLGTRHDRNKPAELVTAPETRLLAKPRSWDLTQARIVIPSAAYPQTTALLAQGGGDRQSHIRSTENWSPFKKPIQGVCGVSLSGCQPSLVLFSILQSSSHSWSLLSRGQASKMNQA